MGMEPFDYLTYKRNKQQVQIQQKVQKKEDRTAVFVCVLTAIFPDRNIKAYRGETKGTIAMKPGTMGKLTYGPVFIPEGFNKVMNDLSYEELGTTHREKALLELLRDIKQ